MENVLIRDNFIITSGNNNMLIIDYKNMTAYYKTKIEIERYNLSDFKLKTLRLSLTTGLNRYNTLEIMSFNDGPNENIKLSNLDNYNLYYTSVFCYEPASIRGYNIQSEFIIISSKNNNFINLFDITINTKELVLTGKIIQHETQYINTEECTIIKNEHIEDLLFLKESKKMKVLTITNSNLSIDFKSKLDFEIDKVTLQDVTINNVAISNEIEHLKDVFNAKRISIM